MSPKALRRLWRSGNGTQSPRWGPFSQWGLGSEDRPLLGIVSGLSGGPGPCFPLSGHLISEQGPYPPYQGKCCRPGDLPDLGTGPFDSPPGPRTERWGPGVPAKQNQPGDHAGPPEVPWVRRARHREEADLGQRDAPTAQEQGQGSQADGTVRAKALRPKSTWFCSAGLHSPQWEPEGLPPCHECGFGPLERPRLARPNSSEALNPCECCMKVPEIPSQAWSRGWAS